MDIVTHAASAMVLAYPFIESHPLESCCFVAGAVLPDIDAFSRIFGKISFLKWHQTYTHSIAGILIESIILWLVLQLYNLGGLMPVVMFIAGSFWHVFMDIANTYGVKLLFPFSLKRYSFEWVFFIDAGYIALTVMFVIQLVMYANSKFLSLFYLILTILYFALKYFLRLIALKSAPVSTVSLIPSATLPWKFYGYAQRSDSLAETFEVNILKGGVNNIQNMEILNEDIPELKSSPEFLLMKELCPAYHVVNNEIENGVQKVVCLDLRTRNFNGLFGKLELFFKAGKLERKVFHV